MIFKRKNKNKNRKILISIAALIILFLIIFSLHFLSPEDVWLCQDGQWVRHGNPTQLKPDSGCGIPKGSITGTILKLSANSLKIKEANNQQKNFQINKNTKLLGKNGQNVEANYLRSGFQIKIEFVGDKITKIQILDEPNIIVSQPQANDEIGPKLTIKGEARVFENTVNYRLKDNEGNILAENFATTNSLDIGLYGSFEVTIPYSQPKSREGVLEVFESSAKDGSEINKVIIPVKFKTD